MLLSRKLLLTVTLTITLFAIYSYKLPQSFLFTSDFGRDMYQSGRIAQGELVLIGSKMNLGGYFVGPYLYYFLAIPLFISGFDINFVLYFHALIFAGAVGFFFWSASRKIHPAKAFLASFSIGILPIYIQSARYPSNGYTFLPFLLILFTWVLFLGFKDRRFSTAVAGILAGIIFNIHPTTIFATGFIFFYLLLFLKEKKLLFLFLGGFLITFLPILFFEFRHNFVMTRDTFINNSYRSFTQDSNTPQFWLHKNPIISSFLFFSGKFKQWVLLSPIFYFGAVLAATAWKMKGKSNKLDLFLLISSILSFILSIIILRFHFEEHYFFSTLFFVVFATVIVLIRSRLWFLLLAIIFIEIILFPKPLYNQSKRSFSSIEQSVKFSIDQNLVTKEEPFNLIQITDAYGLVPIGYEYRFFFRKYGLYPISEYDYKEAKKLIIFSETPFYDIDRFKMWATEEFGREYFSKRKVYHSGPITIYLISRE